MKTLKVEELLKLNRKKFDLVQSSTDGDFEKDYLPVIRSLAEWFNSVPLNSEIYDEPGGAFRCCIESSYFVMRQAKATIFTSDLTSDQRRLYEPQYQYAAFLAAMLSWVDEPFRHYELKNTRAAFNPSIDSGVTSFMLNEIDYSILKREAVLPPSRQRTMMYATKLILKYVDRLGEKVQDSLYSSINPERRPQTSESVLQRVVRKGLAQAEELERKTKNLIVTSQAREVVSPQMMKTNVAEQELPQNEDQTAVAVEANNAPARTESPSSKQQKVSSPKVEDAQISLPIPQFEFPENFPRQYKELLAALAHDIRTGRKKAEETEWISSGLIIPKNFFNNYGKAVVQCLEDLRKHAVILGEVNKNVLINPAVGEMLVPRGSDNV